MAEAATPSSRKRDTRFKPGQSGNPAGKKPGTRNRISQVLEDLMSDEAEAIARTVAEAAKGGDMQAARLVLDRLCPPRKGRAVTFDLPPISTAADVLKAMGAVLQAVAGGDLTPDEGQAMAGLLEIKRKAIETAEIEARLAALEAKGGV